MGFFCYGSVVDSKGTPTKAYSAVELSQMEAEDSESTSEAIDYFTQFVVVGRITRTGFKKELSDFCQIQMELEGFDGRKVGVQHSLMYLSSARLRDAKVGQYVQVLGSIRLNGKEDPPYNVIVEGASYVAAPSNEPIEVPKQPSSPVVETPTVVDSPTEPNNNSPPEIETPVIRTWASADGKFTVKAELVSRSGNDVTLKREDGKEITVPLAGLSRADQEFVNSPPSSPSTKTANRPSDPGAIISEQQSLDNLRGIVTAILNYNGTNRKLPPAYSASSEGTPLLSWRVHILPFIGDASVKQLHAEFKLDEPWNSEHNLKLVARMPSIYKVAENHGQAGLTHYLTPRSENSTFPGNRQVNFGMMTDGTTNSMALLEASHDQSVVWTKPTDLEINLSSPKQGLLGMRDGGFLCAMMNGSCIKLSEEITDEHLSQFFIINDGKQHFLKQYIVAGN